MQWVAPRQVARGAESVLAPIRRVVATAQNGLEVVRLGGLEADTTRSPYEVVERTAMYRLRRYFPDDAAESRPPIVLIPPMMMSADVYDVTKVGGAVAVLHDMGIDPWVVDFGSPDTEEGGWDRTLADHVVSISDIVDRVRAVTGRDVHLGGYSQGGMFAYQAAAYRRSRDIASLVTFGSPVDTLGGMPFGIPAELASNAAGFLADHVFTRLSVTGWMAKTGFQLLDPVKTLKSRLDFVRQLHDREALLPREQQRRFLAEEGWVAWSGPAVAELLRQFVVHNRMMTGGFVIRDSVVSLAEITAPVLAFLGEVDDIGQPVAVRGIRRAAPRAEVYESSLRAGHFGLVVGSSAEVHSWPTTGRWVLWREGLGPAPDDATPMPADVTDEGYTGVSLTARLIHTAASFAEVGVGVGKGLSDLAAGAVRGGVELSGEATRVLPRLQRLGQLQPHTRVSMARVLAEQRRRAPHGECFLFDNRVHDNDAVGRRIDDVVLGLAHCGVRPAGRVGVVMHTRPSALAAVAAVSRIGAVAVLLPTDPRHLAEAVELAGVTRIVADPEHVAVAADTGAHVLVLGGGDLRRIEAGPGQHVTDLEQLDVRSLTAPGWYVPDPGLAREIAFILFAEVGGQLEMRPITNHRWALSAFGTASAANLDRGDTVLCMTPLEHPSCMLVAIGGAIAGGARIAVARGPGAREFGEVVHRYGVTVVSYTWTMLREILDDESMRFGGLHPVRLFLGSGMPVGLWERTLDQFSPAKVLEFYASSEGHVVLANVSGVKVGSMGRPLPGSADVRIGAWDPVARELIEDDKGFVRECADDEVGLLLGRSAAGVEAPGTVLRGVFAPGDSWTPTDHLFRRDTDGDYRIVDHRDSVVVTPHGPVYAQPVVDALSALDKVDLAVVYGVRVGERTVAVAAITSAGRGQPSIAQLDDALDAVPVDQRPDIVFAVDDIPVSGSFRPLVGPLVAAGLPAAGADVRHLDCESGTYRRFTKAAAKALAAGG
ncbi:AMP-binding protein [Rhodococcus sp. HNM0569]|uniref:AMP-binding protein n=1 Tax=Rhodococcus sp. HNM0569 TaxID=2716340 RepID=UPI00146A5CAD|nr:AMP-binding protein [Rhodococcus sp. HNM0569]NLU83075.1 AMP-binding protein [Rhodococcus sp. HNM0569]